MPIDDRVLVDFLRRSYHAVDGLWFMVTEEAGGFDRALEMDSRVWAVLAKIQARKARELTQCAGSTPEELQRCFALKLAADGHEFEAGAAGGEVRFVIRGCPWLGLLRKSGREHLGAQIAEKVCLREGAVWCAEFGGRYEFRIPRMACAGESPCEMRFTARPEV